MTRFFINSYQREWKHKAGINIRYNSTPEEIREARNLRRQGYCLQDIAYML
nr:MAG TPA: hypothetical protein [Caudoviricetes sp.]